MSLDKCMKCGANMIAQTNGTYYCPNCDSIINDLVYRTILQSSHKIVEVIKCKDCKHLNDKGLCFENIKGVGYKKPNPDDFCSHGERKEGENNA